jgi:tetratricopeptide (TPR) repeat protein
MSTVALSPTGAALLGWDLRLAIAAAIDGYDPADERAADVEALRRLTTAGYDPSEGAKLFSLLATEHPERGGLAEIFFYGNRARMTERLAVWRELLGERGPARAVVGGGDGEFARLTRPLVRDNAALDIRAGRFALARRQLDRVLAAAPDDAVAEVHYGELYRLQSQRAEGPERAEAVQRALERYQRAMELSPRYAEPFRQLALLHLQQGDRGKARAAFERCLALAPDGPDARRIRAFLAILGQ